MATQSIKTAAHATVTFFAIPWGGFVAAFLFYVGLTLVAIGVEQVPDDAMTAAYLAPVAAYTFVVLARGVRALAAMPVQVGPLAVLRLQ